MARFPDERHQELLQVRRLLRDDTKFAAGKIAVFQYVAVGVFLFLLFGYWELQVRNEELYLQKAELNRIKAQLIPAPRGKILDREGRIIVDNTASYRLLLSRESLREEHLAPIAAGLNLDAEDLIRRLRRKSRTPRHEVFVLKEKLTPGELAFVESHRGQDAFPELDLVPTPRRVYPAGGMLAHLLGYVGEINEAELNSPEFARYNPGDIIGKFGIERYYNDHLSGTDGQRQIEVDNMGDVHQVLGVKEAIPGKDLKLTIDLDVQAMAELVMQDKRGALVALDPRTGEVLAMVSQPEFDPNQFVGRIDPKEWALINNNPHNPMFNRAIQAQLSPGSTFKPIMALAALESGLIDENFSVNCQGGATYAGRFFKCHSVHGYTTLHRAIAASCDTFFYAVGNKIGIDAIAKYGELAGLGRKTGIDLPGEKEGTLPSPNWKIRTLREKWYLGDTINVSIGQGLLTLTPLQLASAIGGIANGGVWMKPHIVKEDAPLKPLAKADISIDSLAKVVSGMFGVVNEGGGTAGAARLPGIEVCGKTGTAQLASNELQKARNLGEFYRDNAWFVGFAPRNAPEIVVAVLFENGLHGNAAAPMAREVIRVYFERKAARMPAAPPVARLLAPPGGQPQ